MNSRMRRAHAVRTLAAGVVAALALASCGSSQDAREGQSDRQKTVAERGRSVMPFDLEETTHRFTPTPTGGIQDVVADRPGDTEQIDLIRAHLRKEGAAFSRGDFADPARIHGAGMPGLAKLQDGHDRIEVLGLPPVRLHDLRHCAATLSLATGLHMKPSRICWGTPPTR